MGIVHPTTDLNRTEPTKPLRISIAGLMLGIAVAAFPIARLASVLANRPMLGLGVLDMGVQLSGTALAIGLARIVRRRGRCGPFAVGFQAAGWTAVIAYVACCRLFPQIMSALMSITSTRSSRTSWMPTTGKSTRSAWSSVD